MKMIVSDLDGTLFNSDRHDYEISKELISEIQQFKEKGNIFTIATGRPIETSIEVAKNIVVNAPYISYNGAKIVDIYGNEIYSEDFKLDIWFPFLNNIKDIGATIIFYHNGDVFCLEKTDEIYNYEKKEKTKCSEISKEMLNSSLKVNKILIIGKVENYINMWIQLNENILREFKYIISEDNYFEIVKSNVSKGNALKILKKYLNINDNQVISIGNHMNDKELIEEAHIGYAVANATEKLKSIADFITYKEYEQGVIEVIKKYS